MAEPQSSVDVYTKLERVAKLAKEAPDMAFRSLAHFIDVEWLREACRRTRKDGARGVDGQSAKEYEVRLEDSIRQLIRTSKGQSSLHSLAREAPEPNLRLPRLPLTVRLFAASASCHGS